MVRMDRRARMAWCVACGLALLALAATSAPLCANEDTLELDVTYPSAVRQPVLLLTERLHGTAHHPQRGTRLRPAAQPAPDQPPSILPTVRKVLAGIDGQPVTLHALHTSTATLWEAHLAHLLVRLRADETPIWWARFALGWSVADRIEADGLPLRTARTKVDLVPPWEEAPVEKHVIELRCPLGDTPRPVPARVPWEVPTIEALRKTAKVAAPHVAFLHPHEPKILRGLGISQRTVRGAFQVLLPEARRGDLDAVLRICDALEREHGVAVTSFSARSDIDFMNARYVPAGLVAMEWTRVQAWGFAEPKLELLTRLVRATDRDEETVRVRIPAASADALVRLLAAPWVHIRRPGERAFLRPTSPRHVEQGPLMARLVRALAGALENEQRAIAQLVVERGTLDVWLEEPLDPHAGGSWKDTKTRIEAGVLAQWDEHNGGAVLKNRIEGGDITHITPAARDERKRPTRARIGLRLHMVPGRTSRRIPIAPRHEAGMFTRDVRAALPDDIHAHVAPPERSDLRIVDGIDEHAARVRLGPGVETVARLARALERLETISGIRVASLRWQAGGTLTCEVRRDHAWFPVER